MRTLSRGATRDAYDKPASHPFSMNLRHGSHWVRDRGKMQAGTLADFEAAKGPVVTNQR